MADITKCTSKTCTIDSCYRKTAIPSQLQGYSDFTKYLEETSRGLACGQYLSRSEGRTMKDDGEPLFTSAKFPMGFYGGEE